MDKARFKARIYFIDKLKKVDNSVKSVENKDGTLYSGWYKTKIRAEELPDWYIFGTYYKRRGFMSAKGIIDMVYCPSKYSDDFLKDDILLVSYKDKIELREHVASIYDAYVNYDEVVSGVNIIKIIRAAREYSDYDIGDLISDLQAQKDWLTATFPRKAKKEGWDKPAEDMFMNWC